MYKNIRAAVVGSINMDIVLNMKKVPDVGDNVLGTDYRYACGGKGANQAIALSRLGASVRMIGKVADDANGKKLVDNLISNGIDASGVSVDGTQTGLAAIIVDGDGKNRIIVYEGANAEIDADKACEEIRDIDLLMVQFETAEDVVVNSINTAVKKGITTVIDCGPAKDFNLEAMQGATVITPNESETQMLTGVYPDSEENIEKASRILYDRSRAKYVVLKLGDRGCSIFDGKEITILPSYPAKVVDTTAAGDCFTAAMALELVRSGDIYKASDMGNRAGGIAVSRMGADVSMPTFKELSEFNG
ncbi:MAG: ribokinase [Clostridia bacterium]|nr:ribokinase [Clostridia bacterium]